MKIRNNNWIKEGNNYYMIRLRQPYWSAWQVYGWEPNVPGIGISAEMVNRALTEGCGIVVNVQKYGVYRIIPEKMEKYHNQNYLFQSKDKKWLYEFPLNEFDLIVKSKYEKELAEKKEIKRDMSYHQKGLFDIFIPIDSTQTRG